MRLTLKPNVNLMRPVPYKLLIFLVITSKYVEPLAVGNHGIRQGHQVIRVVDPLQIPLGSDGYLDNLRRRLYAKLRFNIYAGNY